MQTLPSIAAYSLHKQGSLPKKSQEPQDSNIFAEKFLFAKLKLFLLTSGRINQHGAAKSAGDVL